MKKQIVLLAILFVAYTSLAQNGFNYKALLTENNSTLSNQNVDLRFTILQNGTSSVYQETQSATTDANGIVSVAVGEGTAISGNFDNIDWAQNYFLKVEIDTGNGYQDFGTTELKYVPYAKYAETAGNTFSGDYNDLTGKPNLSAVATSGDYNDLNNRPIYSVVAGTGNYNDLNHKPAIFFKTGTSVAPTQITDNMYHLGEVYLGRDDAIYPFIKLTVDGSIPNNNTSRMAIYTTINDNGNGAHTGLYADIKGSGGGYQTGLYAMITNSGSGDHFGSVNWLSGNGIGFQTGVLNRIDNSNDNKQIGVWNSLNGNGSGEHTGVYNRLESNGSGQQTGTANLVYTNGDGTHYGTYNDITGGNGDKYGSYNIIDKYSGGTHYGVYSKVHYSRGYAGYFEGKMYISNSLGINTENPTGRLQTIPSGNLNDNGNINAGHAGLIVGTPADGLLFDANQIERKGGTFYINFLSPNDVEIGRGGGNVIVYNKLNSPTTGTADMKAYAYGTIDATGNIQNGSNNFTVNKTGTGVYVISFTGQNFSYSDFSVTANVLYNNSGLKFVKMYYSNHKLVIETKALTINSGMSSINNQNNRFSFMVFKK